jgi:hypothetical protein
MSDSQIETDYLIVGAGAAGLAFVDALIAEADVDVVMVDRRHRPGGHWNDAYPFVRLHQTSANYGVNSRVLGSDSIDATGPNAGFYERATGLEICEYFHKVMDEELLPSGKVRFFGGCDYLGDDSGEHAFTSRLSGQTTTVKVRRKVVDTTYLNVTVPATHTPGFTVDPDARLVPVGDLVAVGEPPTGYTVLGAGKTGMDACNWLLDNGVDPDRIRWVKPRDSWLMDRARLQPLDLVVQTIEGFSFNLEALAQAESVEDLFRRLEDCGQVVRIDPDVEPTMYRGAIISQAERESLRQIERVVRMGRVVHLGSDEIVLEDGTVPTDRGEVHVDCTASGFSTVPARPIFEPGKITLQSLMGAFTTFNAALVGFVESAWDDDEKKNQLCPPVPQPSAAVDWIPVMRGALQSLVAQSTEPELMAWSERSRLNLTRGMADHFEEPRMQAAMGRWGENMEGALTNAERLLAESASQNGQAPAAKVAAS